MIKNVLITGSSYGIGFGIAKFLSSKKTNLILTGRKIKKLNEAKKKIKNKNVHSFKCDFEKDKSVRDLMLKIKKKIQEARYYNL